MVCFSLEGSRKGGFRGGVRGEGVGKREGGWGRGYNEFVRPRIHSEVVEEDRLRGPGVGKSSALVE